MKTCRFNMFNFRDGKNAQNRVVIPPMASQTADENGFVTAATKKHYARLAQAHVGISFVEYSYVHPSGRGEKNQLGVYSDQQIVGLAEIAATLKAVGSLAGLQLVHVGGKTTKELTGGGLMGPSRIAVPVKGWEPLPPEPMTIDQIQLWIEWFVSAAHRAHKAGFDIVELHAAHGYGLNQWLSPLTNQRDDIFGGSIQGRSRLLFRIVERIKKEIPSILISVRLPAQDHMALGLSVSEMSWVVKELEHRGVDLIDVSSGIGGWRRPDHHEGEGYLVDDAAALKQHTQLPIIGVGGIETGAFIERILCQKKVDFAAVGRAILKSPEVWAKEHLAF